MDTFSPKAPTEAARFTFDFERMLGTQEALTGATATMTVKEGTDASPQTMVGTTSVMQSLNGRAAAGIGVMVSGGVLGTRYALTVNATTNAGQTLTLAGTFRVATPV